MLLTLGHLRDHHLSISQPGLPLTRETPAAAGGDCFTGTNAVLRLPLQHGMLVIARMAAVLVLV